MRPCVEHNGEVRIGWLPGYLVTSHQYEGEE